MQQHLLHDDGNKPEGGAALNYVRKITAEPSQGNDEVVLQEEKSVKENQMEKELVLKNFNWKKADEKLLSAHPQD